MEKILIKNFKAIKNTRSIEIPIRNLLLMIGDNASGKSTAATLIYFFKSLKGEVFDFVLKENFDSQSFTRELLNKVRKYFVTLLGATRHLDSFEITYTFANGGYIVLNQNSANKNLDIRYSFFKELRKQCIDVKESLNALSDMASPIFAQSERQRVILQLYHGLNRLFGNEEPLYFLPNRNLVVSLEHRLMPIYADLNRDLISGKNDENISNNDILLLRLIDYLEKTLLPKYRKHRGFKELLQSEEEASEFTNEQMQYFNNILPHLEQMIRGKYVFDNYGEKITYHETDTSQYVHLINASSGQEEIIRILQDFFLVALQNKDVIRIIDEPESHLFPIRQKEFVELCVWLINAKIGKKTLILPTHSPYILTALNNCLYAGSIAETKPQEIAKIVPPHFWLRASQVSAFMINNGELEDLIDPDSEITLIEASRIDQASQLINDTLEQLIQIDNT
jgi:energy-coupling factor transporter ATP-binding protein EcfA2